MAAIESSMIPLGSIAPDFTLIDTISGKELSLAESKGEIATVIMFICNHCPYVIHVREQLVAMANDYLAKKINFIAISSNDIKKYPEDGPAKMKTFAEDLHFSFPYLFDESQRVAKDYDAQCTPDFFVFNKDLKLVYRGQLDDSRPGNNQKVSGHDIRSALECLLNGEEVSPLQKPSIGCNIKWK